MGQVNGEATPGPDVPAYPGSWEADVVLRDGSTTHVRPIRPEDADALQAFHVAQSEASTVLRFFAPLPQLPERDLARFTHVDHVDRVALVAVTQDDAIIGVARYDKISPDEAEVAFNVADVHHGRGLGSVLLEHLAAAARERGVRRFTAEVLPENGRMIAVFREAGYEVHQSLEDGVVQVSFDIDPTDRSLAVQAAREHTAESRSMHGLLHARSVLVVAAPDADPRSVDARAAALVLAGLVSGTRGTGPLPVTGAVTTPGPEASPAGRPGAAADPTDPTDRLQVHVVGAVPGAAPLADERVQVRCWPGLDQVPRQVDLLVLALPPADAVAAVRATARLAVRAVVVLSDGYPAAEGSSWDQHRTLLRIAHAAGARVVGPVSYGLLSHTVDGTLNASLAQDPPPPGRIGMFCQSAAAAVTVLASVRRRGLGLAHLVSAGNRADVSGNDLMQFWEDDPSTDVVALYLESIGNPRKFARIARRLAGVKPVVLATAGRTGHIAAPGHTTRATSAPRRTLEEVMVRSGVVLVDNTHQMLEAAQLFALQPLPAGRRATVVASSPSLAALVAEAAEAVGLVVDHPARIIAEDATDEQVTACFEAAYADPRADAVVTVHVPTLGGRDERVARALACVAAGSGRTSVACLHGLHGATEVLTAPGADGAPRTVPAYTTPEDAVLALGQASRYAAWRSADRGTTVHPPGVRARHARRLVQQWLSEAGHPEHLDLDREQVGALLACAGVHLVPSDPVRDVPEAIEAAERMGWPVALKTTVPTLRHRADLGGVRLDVHGAAELRADVEQVLKLAADHPPAPGGAPLEVQPMAPRGVACVIRSTEDPLYGPVIGFGLAGDTTDLLDDLAYAVPPLTDVDVAEVVRTPRSSARLFGYRGLPQLDVAAVEDVLTRVSVLADVLPEVHALELNPVVVAEQGAHVLGATARVGPPPEQADGGRRALVV